MAFFACTKLPMDKLAQMFHLIFHEGLLTYNPKASKAPLLAQLQAIENAKYHKKGAIFCVRDKSHFTDLGRKRLHHDVYRNST